MLTRRTLNDRQEDRNASILVLKSHFALQCFQPSTSLCTAPPSLPIAFSIRWYDPMNVQWSPIRPLTWTLYTDNSDVAHPVDRDRWAHVEMCPFNLQYCIITQHVNRQTGCFIDFSGFFSDVITKHYTQQLWFVSAESHNAVNVWTENETIEIVGLKLKRWGPHCDVSYCWQNHKTRNSTSCKLFFSYPISVPIYFRFFSTAGTQANVCFHGDAGLLSVVSCLRMLFLVGQVLKCQATTFLGSMLLKTVLWRHIVL